MSTTHIQDMRIYGVTCNKTGKPYFLMREQTFESNCFPQTPNWCTMYFGEWDGLIRRVFGMAETVASNWGLRVGRSTKCNPMDVIRFLRSNVKNGISPLKPIHSISTCNSWGQLNEAQINHVNLYLTTPLTKGYQQINLQEEAAGIAEAFKHSDRSFSAWQLFDSSYNDYESYGGYGHVKLEIAFPNGESKALEVPPMYKIQYADGHGLNALKVMDLDGVEDCRRSYLHHFINDLIEMELSSYGSADKYIRKIYEAEHNPLKLPDHAVVQIKAFNEDGESFIKESFENIPNAQLPVGALAYLVNNSIGGFQNPWLNMGARGTYLKLVGLDESKGGAVNEAENIPKPQVGLVVKYGGAEYQLCKSAGARRGWIVKRCSDGAIFRLSSRRLKDGLKTVAVTAPSVSIGAQQLSLVEESSHA